MYGIQFEQIVSFSLTLHTWAPFVTSEVDRKMKLLGHSISYVIYDQLQGHLIIFLQLVMSFRINYKVTQRLFLMYCLASLFLNRRTLRSFGMNTSIYKHERQILLNFRYRFLISKILICPLPERIQKVQNVFSHVV